IRQSCFFFQAEDGIRAFHVTGVQTCALPILPASGHMRSQPCPFAVAQWRRPIDAGTPMHVRNWTQGITFKAMGVGLLALLMLIPLVQVQSLIGERRGLEGEAQARIAERWGAAQVVGGPVL